MKYVSPFLGEIELHQLGEKSKHYLGETIIEIIYIFGFSKRKSEGKPADGKD